MNNLKLRYLIDECGYLKPMNDDVFWRYIRLLADAYDLKMPVALGATYNKDRIIALVDEATDQLNERGRDILKIRYGLPAGEVMTYKEIAEKYNVSLICIRTLVFNNLRKIKGFLHSRNEKIIVTNEYFAHRSLIVDILEEDLRSYLIYGDSRMILKKTGSAAMAVVFLNKANLLNLKGGIEADKDTIVATVEKQNV